VPIVPLHNPLQSIQGSLKGAISITVVTRLVVICLLAVNADLNHKIMLLKEVQNPVADKCAICLDRKGDLFYHIA